MPIERIKHTKAAHPDVDLTKPVDASEIIKTTTPEDCYTYLWEPGDSLCNVCASFEMCGILFNARLTKAVAKKEKDKGGYLDNIHFDSLAHEDVIAWLKKKQRTSKDFINMVQKYSECSDRDTVRYWCKSFIKEYENISVQNGLIIVE